MSEKAREAYVEAVKAALDDCDTKAVTKAEYVDALEEILSDVETYLSAAKSELDEESK